MYVIEVIPLKRAVQVESLSYFASESYAVGTIVSVPLRNKDTRGIVIETKPVSGAKTALRAATFSLRKLPKQAPTSVLSNAFIDTAKDLAEYYASSTGAVLYQLLPPDIREGKIAVPHTAELTATEKRTPEVLCNTHEERYRLYRALIREAFAHSGSTLCIVPSSTEAREAATDLGAGIEERVVTLTSTMTLRQLREAYAALEDLRKPKLIIATPSHAMIERHDITTTIIEKSGSSLYRERTRPFIDIRTAVTRYAHHTKRRLIFGDLLPRTEEEVLRRAEHYATYEEGANRLALSGKLSVIRMADTPQPNVPFALFAKQTLTAIEKTRKTKGRVFLFAARRGLSPVVACLDCGHIFRSPDSGAPYSLVRIRRNNTEERWFVCGVSGHRERAADVCTACGSWRLRERGIGIQQVYDELTKELDGVPIILFDHTSANTFKKASFLADKFYETKGAIMIGTQMALPYLTKPVSTSIVVNMDALRATPTWRQQEDTFRTLLALREYTTDSVLVQTRQQPASEEADTPDEFLEYVRTGAIRKFYDEEIMLRSQFNYPPYAHFVHLTWQGSKSVITDTEAVVQKTLDAYKPLFYSAPPSPKGVHIRYALLRIPAPEGVLSGIWPDKPLVERLRALPPSVRIVMNPDRIV